MPQVIRVTEVLFDRLKALAEPFVDTPADVIERLIDHYERSPKKQDLQPAPLGGKRSASQTPLNREPRERGTTVELDDRVIHADTVADMYRQILKYLVDNGAMESFQSLIPFKTSSRRFLIARHPEHPNGRPFVSPVEYEGYYMESHKAYATAIKQLTQFLATGDVELKYRG